MEERRALSDWAQSVVASDLLAEVLRLGLKRLMEVERDAYVNVEPHGRTEDRKAQRNGYRTRRLVTRTGEPNTATQRPGGDD